MQSTLSHLIHVGDNNSNIDAPSCGPKLYRGCWDDLEYETGLMCLETNIWNNFKIYLATHNKIFGDSLFGKLLV